MDCWPAPATLAQHLTNIGSMSACTRRQQYALPDPQLLTGHIVFRTSPGVKIFKLLPNWLSWRFSYCRYKKTTDWADDLVTVDIKNGFHTSKYLFSTVHWSHLITLITKTFDTTSISYQPLWLCCWRRYISSFFVYKKLDSSSLYRIYIV